MISDPAILLSAFLLGFLGSAHCVGMCGGLSAALGLNTLPGHSPSSPQISSFYKLMAYNIGRITSYCFAGLIVGSLGFWLAQQLSALSILRYLAALMLILMGLYLGQWFNGIAFTEKLGHYLWKLIQPLGRRFLPVENVRDAFFIGLVWGWLPCGLVYSALVWASLEASIHGAMLVMLFFGLGTLPSMLTTGLFAQQIASLIKQSWFRKSSAALMIVFGLWSMPIIQSTFI